MSAIIMSWSKCSIEIGKTGAADAMAAALTSIGTIKDKSTSMETTEGDKLEAKATGGVRVGFASQEPNVTLTTRIMEPDFATLATLIGATNDSGGGELKITSLLVDEPHSVKLTPKNIGATGVKIRKAHIDYKEGYSEEEGHYADLTFTVLECADGELYTKFKKTEPAG